jgi:S1-C subfamily serine protease
MQSLTLEILKLKKRTAFILALGVTLSLSSTGAGQTPVVTKQPDTGSATVESKPTAPQVITVLHRINGLKMLRLLIRSGEKVDAVDSLDQASQMAGQVHTSIIAGLTLEDGETIAAWLPEAEIEVESNSLSRLRGATNPFVVGVPGPMGTFSEFDRPDITIIGRDGTRHQVRYVGLDGVTGMSLLKVAEKIFPGLPDVQDLEILVGQRMRLFSPEPVPETGVSRSDGIYVRIGETEAQVVSIDRGASGAINRIRIRSGKLLPSNIGGVAVNNEGQTIGIVESIEGTEGNVLPAALIRAAAKRVLARQTSVPRPWLGISGESVASASIDQIVRNGWAASRAMSLIENQRGILLTSVAPGSPAALAALHVGDVIVSVDNSEVKSRDDFTLLLAEAGEAPLRFAVMRPGARASQLVSVKLTESPDPFFAFNFPGTTSVPRPLLSNPLMKQGIETVPLRASLRTHLGTSGGLLVVHVQPGSAAFKAGLLPGDVIEAIDGRRILPVATIPKGANPAKVVVSPMPQPLRGARFTLEVLRNKETLVLTVVAGQE